MRITTRLTRRAACLGLFSGLALSAFGQTPPPPDNGQLPVKPPPIPGGVVPLPTGPANTSIQGPLPTPVQPLPDGTHPMAWSPDLAAVQKYLEKGPISMQEAVAIALYASKPFAATMAAWQAAAARTGQARAQLYPNLSLNGQINDYTMAEMINFGGAPFLVQNQFNPIYTAAFSWPLDILGTIRSAVSQAQFADVAARIDVNRARSQVVFDVKNAFYNVLRAQAQLGVATNNLNNSLVSLEFADKNYAAGTSARFDVLTAQRNVADAQQAVISGKGAVASNLALLKMTIGLDPHTHLSIRADGAVEFPPDISATAAPVGSVPTNAARSTAASETVPMVPANGQPISDDFDFGPEYDALLKEAIDNRPEILEAAAQISAAQHGLEYARRSILPSFNLDLDYIWTPNAAAFVPQHIGVATLNVSVPIFDGFLARERVREARAQQATADVNRRSARDQVVVDVQQAYIALVQARQRVAVAKVEVSQAQEALRVGRVRYQAGVSQQALVSPQLELSNSQVSLDQAQENEVNALYDYNAARAQLDRALGRNAFTGSAPGYPSKPGKSVTGQATAAGG